MLYAYIVLNGVVNVVNVSGMTAGEVDRARAAGWHTYWTTDRNALRDAEELALA
jgi:hypothetical protein